VRLALALKDIRPAGIVFVQYPVVADPRDSNRVVESTADAAALNAALNADEKFTLGDDSAGRGSVSDGSVAAGTTTPSAPSDTASPSDATSGSASPVDPAATTAPTTTLPSTITGQSAAEATCSVGSSR